MAILYKKEWRTVAHLVSFTTANQRPAFTNRTHAQFTNIIACRFRGILKVASEETIPWEPYYKTRQVSLFTSDSTTAIRYENRTTVGLTTGTLQIVQNA